MGDNKTKWSLWDSSFWKNELTLLLPWGLIELQSFKLILFLYLTFTTYLWIRPVLSISFVFCLSNKGGNNRTLHIRKIHLLYFLLKWVKQHIIKEQFCHELFCVRTVIYLSIVNLCCFSSFCESGFSLQSKLLMSNSYCFADVIYSTSMPFYHTLKLDSILKVILTREVAKTFLKC